VKIEKDVPIPGRRGVRGVTALLRQLSPGESVLVPLPIGALSSQVRRVTAEEGRTFTRRSVEGGTRIWRTA
jgi:hypothetical protein